MEYEMSFMTTEVMQEILGQINKTSNPFCFINWKNFIVLPRIDEKSVAAAVEYLKKYGELEGYAQPMFNKL